MNKLRITLIFALAVIIVVALYAEQKHRQALTAVDAAISRHGELLVQQGRQIFRYDTFGDQDYWGLLGLHQAIEGTSLGGVGLGVSPATALAVGLKVDQDALPPVLVQQIRAGRVNLNDPAVTLALLKLNAVVGLTGFFKPDGTLQSVGIQCALCHSTVDNAFAPGIGHRLDGWANRDLNIGAIIALSPNLQPVADVLEVDVPTVRAVLNSWGPGRFDAELFMDGKAFRPDGKTAAVLIPPAFGLAGVNLHTYTGWGSVPYWNAFVANLEMHGKGTFSDPRLNDQAKYPIAVENSFFNIVNDPDLITSKLPALRAYQHSLKVPKAPAGSFDRVAAERGKAIFIYKAKCASCHDPKWYTQEETILKSAAEIGIDDFEAMRSPTGKYRTTPLPGLAAARSKGGYFHDGRFATLPDVVNHYNDFLKLNLTSAEKHDLVEYLKSL